jgi:hypothetical protein
MPVLSLPASFKRRGRLPLSGEHPISVRRANNRTVYRKFSHSRCLTTLAPQPPHKAANGASSPAHRVLTASFATRKSRVQIPSAPPRKVSWPLEYSRGDPDSEILVATVGAARAPNVRVRDPSCGNPVTVGAVRNQGRVGRVHSAGAWGYWCRHLLLRSIAGGPQGSLRTKTRRSPVTQACSNEVPLVHGEHAVRSLLPAASRPLQGRVPPEPVIRSPICQDL